MASGGVVVVVVVVAVAVVFLLSLGTNALFFYAKFSETIAVLN